jgi:hypothetical protein
MTPYKTVFFYLICRDGRDGLCLLMMSVSSQESNYGYRQT